MKEKTGENVTCSLRNTLHKILPEDVESKFIQAGTKLSAKFHIKNKNKDNNKHDLVHYAKCPECGESYVGETGRILQDRVDQHSGKDSTSNILRHSCQENHKNVSSRNSKFLDMDTRKRNLNESYLRYYKLKSYAPL